MNQYQIATVVGVIRQYNQNLVKVRSLKSAEECKKDGTSYEWFINEFSFTADPEMTRFRLGIDIDEYERLLAKIRNKG